MPNYKYKGSVCEESFKYFSSKMTAPKNDPKQGSPCECGADGCLLVRGITLPTKPMGLKTWAGDWFAKTYGKDIGDAAAEVVKKKREEAALEERVRKDGVNIKFHSRQVESENCIKIPKKKDD